MLLFVIFLNVSWTILDNSTSDKNICLRRYFRLLKVNCDGTIELQSKVRVVSFYLLLQCYSEGTSKIDVQPFLAFFYLWCSILLTYLTSQWSFSNSLWKLSPQTLLWISIMSGWQKIGRDVFQKMFVTKFLFWTSELIFLKENNFRKIQMILLAEFGTF